MTESGDYISFGLDRAGGAVMDIIAHDNLQLYPKTMPRTRRAKANGRLKQIEQIVRRLIFLMALALKLEPPQPREPRKEPDLPDGVELAIFPRVPQRRFVLMPSAQAMTGSEPLPCSVRAVSGPPGPVPTAPLVQRIVALQRVLKAPAAAAKRLARTIERLKAKGDPKPYVGPPQSAFRLGHELGALASALPGLLNAALESWEESG